PTNHLDLDALLWLEDFLAAYGKTVLVISHDRYFLDRVTTRTLQLEYGRAAMYEGSYSLSKQKREADEASLAHRYKEQQKEIARIKRNIEFQRRCGQEHNFVTIRAKQKQLDRMEKISLPPPPPKTVRLSFGEEASVANDVMKVRDLTFGYSKEKPLIDKLSFLVKRGERVMLLGANGSGKSTLMKLMTGELTPRSGLTEAGYGIKIGYYDQENKSLHNDMTVFEEMRAAHPTKTDFELRSALALFLFGAEDIERRVGLLSGGERARLSLAKLMLEKVNLLLLDEPTNHLDIGSREALEAAVDAFDGTVIAVSHDRYFIDLLATRIIELDRTRENGCINYPLETYEGAYDTYLKLREADRQKKREAEKEEAADDSARRRYEERKKGQADERNQKKRIERAERRVGEIEGELEKIDAELFGDAASDYLRAAELEEKKARLEEELLSLYELLM
ncbi:MAG: ATP-binding cassette domain-containing protein, partial [Clostridia bacterium]|nr:ATP-binding cassette domain-containing protein [Clostridia bacterium]